MRLKKREYYEKCDDGAKIAIKRDDKKEQYSSLEELLKDMEKIIEEIKTRLSQPRQT
jgi:NADH:ubiquinone oxidoreductase subunit F (NADH-binding)